MATVKAEHSAPIEHISRSLLVFRGQRVILDRELALIYGTTTKRLNEQVKRNHDRFPADFMFQLTTGEARRSRSQFATLNDARGQNIKYRPYAFTEHGAIQAANVLNSSRAIAMGVYVDRRHSCSDSRSHAASSPRKPRNRFHSKHRQETVAICAKA